MGMIFKKKWKNKKMGEMVQGATWWIKYYRHGKPYYESTHSGREAVANKLLKLREGSIAKGELPGIHFGKVYFDDLAEDYLTDYLINKKKSLRDARRNVRKVKCSVVEEGIPTAIGILKVKCNSNNFINTSHVPSNQTHRFSLRPQFRCH